MSNHTEKSTNQRLMDIEAKLDRLLDLTLALQSVKSRRIVAQADMRRKHSPELQHRRVEAVETIFHKMLSTLYTKRRDSYKFPLALMENPAEPVRQAVLLSTLVNQCSLRQAFRPVAGEGGMTPAEIAKRAIEDSNLLVVRIRDTGWGVQDTQIVISPAEALKSLVDKSKLPLEWKGWTCRERMGGTHTAVGWKPAPHDPSGTRDWPGIARVACVQTVEGFGPDDDGTAAAYEDEEEDHEDEPLPVKRNPAPVTFDFSSAADDGADEESNNLFDDIEDDDEKHDEPEVSGERAQFDPAAWEAAAAEAEPIRRNPLKINVNLGTKKS